MGQEHVAACGFRPMPGRVPWSDTARLGILSSAAVGDIQPIANNDTPQGRAANRRVVVQVLTNKGLEGL